MKPRVGDVIRVFHPPAPRKAHHDRFLSSVRHRYLRVTWIDPDFDVMESDVVSRRTGEVVGRLACTLTAVDRSCWLLVKSAGVAPRQEAR